MTHYLRLLPFVLFLTLGLRLGLGGRRATTSRLNAFLAYTIAVSLLAGFTQREFWPFPAHRIFAAYHEPGGLWNGLALRLVDASGRECEIDPLFASPMAWPTLEVWFLRTYPTLTRAEQDRAGAFLLARANTAPAVARASESRVGQVLRGLAAPPHFALYAITRAGDGDCAPPYTALRLYREEWRPVERVFDRSRVSRTLVGEHRRS